MKLADDQRAGLGMLNASVRGRTEALMLAHGFTLGCYTGWSEMASLPLCGSPHTPIGRAVLVTMMKITDAGRRALNE
jgi:hypothetical protein